MGVIDSVKMCAVHRSGRVLSFQVPDHDEVFVPRPGPQHDQRRLCLLHVPTATHEAAEQALEQGRW